MRARKPQSSRGDGCLRCAAILRPTASMCGLCGWPVGQPFSEPDRVDAAEEQPAATQAELEEGPAGDRAELATHATLPPVGAATPAAEGIREPNLDSPRQPATAVAPVAPVSRAAQPSPIERREPALAAARSSTVTDDLDPLTAPLGLLTGESTELDTDLRGAPGELVEPTFQADHGDRPGGSPDDRAPVADPADALSDSPATTPEVDSDVEAALPEEAAPAVSAKPSPLATAAAAMILVVGVGNLVVPLLTSFLLPLDGASLTGVLVNAVAGLAMLAGWISAAVLFLVWVARARTVVAETSPVRQRWSRPLAIGGWLIPIAGLIIGWQVLQDLWGASNPKTRDDANLRPQEPALITGWLAGLAVTSVLSLLGSWVLGTSLGLEVAQGVALLASAVCLAKAVRTISAWQTAAR